jgi:hypothetical protein
MRFRGPDVYAGVPWHLADQRDQALDEARG